jgi:hypothetical protein
MCRPPGAREAEERPERGGLGGLRRHRRRTRAPAGRPARIHDDGDCPRADRLPAERGHAAQHPIVEDVHRGRPPRRLALTRSSTSSQAWSCTSSPPLTSRRRSRRCTTGSGHEGSSPTAATSSTTSPDSSGLTSRSSQARAAPGGYVRRPGRNRRGRCPFARGGETCFDAGSISPARSSGQAGATASGAPLSLSERGPPGALLEPRADLPQVRRVEGSSTRCFGSNVVRGPTSRGTPGNPPEQTSDPARTRAGRGGRPDAEGRHREPSGPFSEWIQGAVPALVRGSLRTYGRNVRRGAAARLRGAGREHPGLPDAPATGPPGASTTTSTSRTSRATPARCAATRASRPSALRGSGSGRRRPA